MQFHKSGKKLFQIADNDEFGLELGVVLGIYENPEASLKTPNHAKKTLALCMMLEDAGQADTILNFFDEHPDYINDGVKALYEIGALKSADIIKQAAEIFPSLPKKEKGWDTENEVWNNLMKLDAQFSDYSDGNMRDLYRNYAEKHKSDFV